MAAPRNRRAGFSRKAQLQLFLGYLLAFTGAFAGLFLLALSFLDPAAFAVLRGTANDATAPISRTLTGIRIASQSGWQNSSAYFDAASKNAKLQREVDANRAALIEARAIKLENIELRGLIGVIEAEGQVVATARLINSSSTSSRRFATLGAGANQGVKRGQPVRSVKGLVGRILEVRGNSAQVLLLTDAENVVPVKRVRDGVVAFSEGRSDGRVNIRLVNAGINPLKKGDIMVTSGNGGLYAPNVPVAVVATLTSDGAIANLLASPGGTNYVTVQRVFTMKDASADAAIAANGENAANSIRGDGAAGAQTGAESGSQ